MLLFAAVPFSAAFVLAADLHGVTISCWVPTHEMIGNCAHKIGISLRCSGKGMRDTPTRRQQTMAASSQGIKNLLQKLRSLVLLFQMSIQFVTLRS